MNENKALTIMLVAIMVVATVGIIMASISDIKQTEAKEKTKQIAMQLEMARLEAGITNKVVINEDK